MRSRFWSCVSSLLVLAACGGDEKDPFTGVLHPADSGLMGQDSSLPMSDGGVDANPSQDAGHDAHVQVDAGHDAGFDAGPPSPLDGTEATNMPNAVVMYGGSEPNPGLTIVASHLELDPIGEALSVDFYARIRNDFSDSLCYFGLTFRLLDQNGFTLFDLGALSDLEPHDTSIGYGDCASPGEEFYVYATDFLDFGASTHTTDRVAVIEWVYDLGGGLYTNYPSNDAVASDLNVVPGTYEGTYMLTGSIDNITSVSIGFPSIAAYVLNQGGQPLDRLYDITTSPIGPYGSWQFETGTARFEFTPLDIDYVISYQDP